MTVAGQGLLVYRTRLTWYGALATLAHQKRSEVSSQFHSTRRAWEFAYLLTLQVSRLSSEDTGLRFIAWSAAHRPRLGIVP